MNKMPNKTTNLTVIYTLQNRIRLSYLFCLCTCIVMNSCGEKKISREDACDYFVELRDSPKSEKSKKILIKYKENIKNYSFEVMTNFGVNESDMEDGWRENENAELDLYGQQYFLEVCQSKR